MEFNEVIKTRWSVRSFSDKKVEQDKLLRILETAKTAPTAKNMQPVRIICAQSDKALADFKKNKSVYLRRAVDFCRLQ